MKHKVLYTVLTVVLTIGLYNLFEYLYQNFISHQSYHFEVLVPLVTGLTVSIVTLLLNKTKK